MRLLADYLYDQMLCDSRWLWNKLLKKLLFELLIALLVELIKKILLG